MSLLPLRPASINKLANSVRAGNDGQLGQAAQHEPVAVAPVQLGGGDGEAEFGEAVQQRPEGELALRACQRGAEAVVDAVPEREVTRISWKIVESSSWVLRRSSPSRALISPLTRSSAGAACLAWTSSASIAATASDAFLARA